MPHSTSINRGNGFFGALCSSTRSAKTSNTAINLRKTNITGTSSIGYDSSCQSISPPYGWMSLKQKISRWLCPGLPRIARCMDTIKPGKEINSTRTQERNTLSSGATNITEAVLWNCMEQKFVLWNKAIRNSRIQSNQNCHSPSTCCSRVKNISTSKIAGMYLNGTALYYPTSTYVDQVRCGNPNQQNQN